MALITPRNIATSKLTDGTDFLQSLPAGTVLQVQQNVMDGYAHYSGGTWYHLTDMTTNITPRSASSKILVRFQISISAVDRYHITKMFRAINNGTDVQIGHGDPGSNTARQKAFATLGTGSRLNGHSTYEQLTVSAEFLDSPNTTQVVTYKPHVGVYSNHAFTVNAVHYNSGNQNDQWNSAPFSALTVMEIAG